MPGTSPFRLLVFSEHFPPAWGGTSRILGGLFSQFSADEVTVLTRTTHSRDESEWARSLLGMKRIAGGPPDPFRLIDRKMGMGVFEWLWIQLRVRSAMRLDRHTQFSAILGQIPGPEYALSALLAHRTTGLPLFFYYVDTTMPYPGETRWRRRLLDTHERSWLEASEHVFFCSEALAEDVASRHPVRSSSILRHSIPCEELISSAAIRRRSGDPARVVFVGTVRRRSHFRPLALAIEALEDLSQEKKVRFDLFSNVTRSALLSYGAKDADFWSVSRCGPRQVIDEQRKSDLILVSIDDQSPLQPLLRTIFPTRAIEAMTTGVPILLLCPEDAFPAQYARETGFAYVVSDFRKESIRDSIDRLLTDEDLRVEVASKALLTVRSNHDSRAIAADFKRRIVDACLR